VPLASSLEEALLSQWWVAKALAGLLAAIAGYGCMLVMVTAARGARAAAPGCSAGEAEIRNVTISNLMLPEKTTCRLTENLPLETSLFGKSQL
jgi:hypothetical protein